MSEFDAGRVLRAAESIEASVRNLEGHLFEHRQFMEQWLVRLEAAVAPPADPAALPPPTQRTSQPGRPSPESADPRASPPLTCETPNVVVGRLGAPGVCMCSHPKGAHADAFGQFGECGNGNCSCREYAPLVGGIGKRGTGTPPGARVPQVCGRPVIDSNLRCTMDEGTHDVPHGCTWSALAPAGHEEYRRATGDCLFAYGACPHCKDRKPAGSPAVRRGTPGAGTGEP